MLIHLRPAFVLLLLFSVLTGVVYPFAVWSVGSAFFERQARGSLIEHEGRVVGSTLLGQPFTADRYFHGRPSAAGAGYDAAASSGSNLGPTSRALGERIAAEHQRLAADNPGTAVPADLLMASASGLDPHITPEAARFQVPRVARARALSENALRALVEQQVEPRLLGVLGEPRVNLLQLNLALDELQRP